MQSAIFVALLSMTQPANTAAQVAPAAPIAKPDVVVEGSKLVCRRETAIGSNIPGKRVCKPGSQLLAEQRAGQDAAKEFVIPSGASSNN